MQYDLSLNIFTRFHKLDVKKIIILALLSRLIFACIYDVFVSITGSDILLPDSAFYATIGRYMSLFLSGYDKYSIPVHALPKEPTERALFLDLLSKDNKEFFQSKNEGIIFYYIVSILYVIFGPSVIVIRIFNICISVLSTYLIYKITDKNFGELAAKMFLVVGLLLPSQVIYSITLSRDILRVFAVYLILWVLYGRK
ncbi:MAG: hypothetical protein A2987_06280 [Omnitrophica bacterium RIFCSPLOWO2_01_FULL_45_10]|nr:MAG: hypothetical protein A2987_06280 [Omnitrophica bacterium RIFCSPLOWO2_01_FULL_45_10]